MSQLIGWIGTALIVSAYAVTTAKKADPRDARILLLSLLGALGVGVSVFVQRAWPALALQIVWGTIALIGLARGRRTP